MERSQEFRSSGVEYPPHKMPSRAGYCLAWVVRRGFGRSFALVCAVVARMLGVS